MMVQTQSLRSVFILFAIVYAVCGTEPDSSLDPLSGGCTSNQYRCLDGRCVTREADCDVTETIICNYATEVQCVGEEKCIRVTDQCNGYCDCTNCTDEDAMLCHLEVHNGNITEAKFFPTSTLLLAACAFVLWSVYVYFKRKIRTARFRNQATFHIEEASLRSPASNEFTPVVSLPTDPSNPTVVTNRTQTLALENDAPPSYSEAVASPPYDSQSSLLQAQGSIPPPPSYDTAIRGSAQT